jgi:hypothetical protein
MNEETIQHYATVSVWSLIYFKKSNKKKNTKSQGGLNFLVGLEPTLKIKTSLLLFKIN